MIQRKFILGDEWLYYKLYCGKKTADSILIDVIRPLTEKLLTNKLINKWFFIRYIDSDPHLRVRFHFEDISKIGVVIDEVKKAIQDYVDGDIIWKVQVDTYQREIERYGIETVSVSEKLFYIDSDICIRALDLIEDDSLLFMFALRSVNDILSLFNFSINDKVLFTKNNLNVFKREFNSNKMLNKQLNKKYQDIKEQFVEFMDMQNHKEYQLLINLLSIKNNRLFKLKKDNFKKEILDSTTMGNLLSSYIHMMLNRLFRDKQRLHELVCYDCLYRYYNFKLATT